MRKVIVRLTSDDLLVSTFLSGGINGDSNSTTLVSAISDEAASNGSIVKRTSDGTINASYLSSTGISETSGGTAVPGIGGKLSFFDVSTPIVRPTVSSPPGSISTLLANDISSTSSSSEIATEFNELRSDVSNLKSDIENINTSLTSLIQGLTNLGLIQ
jgi:hypothetical protein